MNIEKINEKISEVTLKKVCQLCLTSATIGLTLNIWILETWVVLFFNDAKNKTIQVLRNIENPNKSEDKDYDNMKRKKRQVPNV